MWHRFCRTSSKQVHCKPVSRWNPHFRSSFKLRYPVFIALSILPFARVTDSQGQTTNVPIQNLGSFAAFCIGAGATIGALSAIAYGKFNQEPEQKPISGKIEFDYGWRAHATDCVWTKNRDNMVKFSGLAGSWTKSSGNGPITSKPLPEHVRPWQTVYTSGVDMGGRLCRIYVHKSGLITIEGSYVSNNPAGIDNWISLEGISYYTEPPKSKL